MKTAFNTLSVIGSSNIANEPRQSEDYYATDPRAVHMLLEKEDFSHIIWEPACGEGHISESLKQAGHFVISSDIIDRGYGAVADFFSITSPPHYMLI